MAKSPAFNFYSSDFLTGTTLMNFTQKGKYIHLLCLQHQQGHLEEEDFIDIVGDDKKLLSKFILDNEGKYYNEDLEKIITQKALHIEHQRENALKRWNKKPMPRQCDGNAMAMPLEIEIEIEDNNSNSIRDIIDYLNNRIDTNYKPNSKIAIKNITARLKDGYTIDDFKKVIDKKAKEWLGTDFEKFLTPDTLFGNKFEMYLNQKRKKTLDEIVEEME